MGGSDGIGGITKEVGLGCNAYCDGIGGITKGGVDCNGYCDGGGC